MIDPVTQVALTDNVPLAHGILRLAIYNCIMAGRVKSKPTAELFVKALTDNEFVIRNNRRLRRIIATIDSHHGAFGPDSSFWIDNPSDWDVQASAESRRIRQALPTYTTNRQQGDQQ